MRIRHLWYHANQSRVAGRESRVGTPRTCDPAGTTAKLSGTPQPALGWFSRVIAFVTTPFKFLGISGWIDTGCSGEGSGRLVRDAQHSSDGFWTVDVALKRFSIGGLETPPDRYLRLECEPGTAAHGVCADRPLLAGQTLRFGGPIVVDTDGPFLESHPDNDFEVVIEDVDASHESFSRESRVGRRASRLRGVRHSTIFEADEPLTGR